MGWAARSGHIYLGAGESGPVWAPAEHAVLVLGPPRSGKTSSIVVPSVLGAAGAVVSTSTKPDVLDSTHRWRRRQGRCLLFDPSGTVDAPPGVEVVRWSPVTGCTKWDEAMLVTRALVGATSRHSAGDSAGGLDHWHERAEALLGTLFHAAALGGVPMETVLSWVDRHQPAPALALLDEAGAVRPADLLAGIATTEGREQSGIWSTASGVLAAYRSEAVLAGARAPDFDASAFCHSDSTLYICASARHQALMAPVVVGLLTEIRSAAYAQAAAGPGAGRAAPVVLALDEVANIAPLPDLPAMVSEGGGQGLLTLACLQDLSQARGRWGQAADGFLSLFGTTVVMPGIGDVRTLEALSTLAGDHELPTRSVSAAAPGGPASLLGLLSRGGSSSRGRTAPTVTVSSRPARRLPVDALAQGRPGQALMVDSRNRIRELALTPWFAHEPWRSQGRGGSERALERGVDSSSDLGR